MAVTSSLESPLAPATATPVAAPEPAPSNQEPDPPAQDDDGSYGRGPDIPVKDFLVDQIDQINLAENYAPDVLAKLGQLVSFEYEIDENSRSDWKDKAEKAMKFATQEAEEKQYPWPKACLSLDTDILLTMRTLKRKEGTPSERAFDSMKTGMTMSIAAIVSFHGVSALVFL